MPALRINAPLAPVLREPRASSEQISQYRFGHLFVEMARRGEWVQGRGFDDYEGWVHQGYLSAAEESADTWRSPRLSLGCRVTYQGRAMELPLGAVIPAKATVESGEAVGEAEFAIRFPPEAAAIVHSAATLFPGTPYVWGGITPWGADCSGFTQTIFALHGTPLPRDSPQQALCGEPAAESPLEAEAADLMFFSEREDGRVTHVAIALGSGSLAHCAIGRGGHRVEDMNAPDEYLAALLRRFRFARRVLRR